MKHKLAVIGCSVGCLLFAADGPKPSVQVVKTERLEFPSNGALTLANSIGVVTVEGWDQPDVEITTIKSTKKEYDSRERERVPHELDTVRISTERHGDELVITTDFPRHRGLPPPSPLGGGTSFNLEYAIKAPRSARLIVDHDVGEVNVNNILGDIRITALQGQITLHLPEERHYAIDANSDFGSVTSDFLGRPKRRPWLIGHQLAQHDPGAAQRLHLRIGYGDIVILQIRKPLYPAPVSQ